MLVQDDKDNSETHLPAYKYACGSFPSQNIVFLSGRMSAKIALTDFVRNPNRII
jgi:hypothetical protein